MLLVLILFLAVSSVALFFLKRDRQTIYLLGLCYSFLCLSIGMTVEGWRAVAGAEKFFVSGYTDSALAVLSHVPLLEMGIYDCPWLVSVSHFPVADSNVLQYGSCSPPL